MRLAFFLAACLSAQTLVLTRANVVDGVANEPVRNATIVIRDGKIASLEPGGAPPAGATVFDLEGKWVTPGFVDAHVHIRNLEDARRALRYGTTTARSLGVDHYVDAGLRDLHRAGMKDIPEILASGYHVRPRAAEPMFLDHPSLMDLMNGAVGTLNVRRLVKANLERKIDVIKINATERAGLPETDPRKRLFSDDELSAIVDEAKTRGIPVAAHAHGNEGAFAAVKAGVHSIEHGTYLSAETLALMKQKGTYFVPTIATVEDLIQPGGDYDDAGLQVRGRHMYPRIKETAAAAWRAGIRLVAGTDTGYGPRSNRRMPHEVMELAAAGMPPVEAIKAATSVAAECLGIARRTGSLRPGMEADLVVVERSPLADVGNLQDVLFVVNDGKVAVNRLKW